MLLVAPPVLRYAEPMSLLRCVVVSTFGIIVGASIGCQDPCVTLAERICNCEATANERRACIADRVTNQQSSTTIDDADRDFCEQKLLECTCQALDNNDFAACGFANESVE